jgi:hypothetical protein
VGKCVSDQRTSADESCLCRSMCKHVLFDCSLAAKVILRVLWNFSEFMHTVATVKCEQYCQTLAELNARLW